MEWFTGPSLVVGVVVLLIVGALIAWGIHNLEARRRRDEAAARLSTALTGPLTHEPALAGAGIMPVVTWSMRGRPRVELTGWVRSREMRQAAIRIAEREAAKLGRSVRIVDSLEVMDHEQQRGA
jgi:hypothetical protein